MCVSYNVLTIFKSQRTVGNKRPPIAHESGDKLQSQQNFIYFLRHEHEQHTYTHTKRDEQTLKAHESGTYDMSIHFHPKKRKLCHYNFIMCSSIHLSSSIIFAHREKKSAQNVETTVARKET
jgi:hypothetical protein